MGMAVDAEEVGNVRRRLHALAEEAGLSACTLWLPIAAEHVERAMEWIAAEIAPRLAQPPSFGR